MDRERGKQERMKQILSKLKTHRAEEFITSLTGEEIIQSERDVIKSFRNFQLTDEVINALFYYMFFMDPKVSWDKLSKIAQYFSEQDITTAEEAIDTMEKLKQYEEQINHDES